MTRTLSGRVAVVTGVTAGIGRVLAARLVTAGAIVVGCARDEQRLEAVAAKVPGLDAVRCDVRDRVERAELVRSVVDRFGRVDVLVNNAAVGYLGSVVDMTAEDVERVVATDITAVIDLTRLVLPGMLRRRDGDVLVVSSVAAWVSFPPLSAYAASKRAVDGFVEGLRREVGPHGIRVHSVNPGPVATEFHARALGLQPRERDPGVHHAPGIRPERVACRAVRELRSGRGRTVAVPRALGLVRMLAVPPVAHVADIAIRAAAGWLAWLGRSVAFRWAPAARRDRS